MLMALPNSMPAAEVGGHVGFGFPLVTKDGGNVSILWRLGHGFAAGSRVGFLINPDQTKTAQFGITPLIIKSWPIEHSYFKAYFVEGDFVFRFNRPVDGPATNPFTFNMVLGVSF
jgi:hypothetical protein